LIAIGNICRLYHAARNDAIAAAVAAWRARRLRALAARLARRLADALDNEINLYYNSINSRRGGRER